MFLNKFKTFFFAIFLSFLVISTYAQNLGYDPYTSELPEEKKYRISEAISKAIAFPFDILRWPMDKSLVWTEEEKIPEKIKWIYSQLKKKGLSPYFSFSGDDYFSTGLDVSLPRLFEKNVDYPDLIWDAWIYYGYDFFFKTGTEIGFDRIADTNFFSSVILDYENRTQEDFYGIGPDTSKGDGVSFGKDVWKLENKFGYKFNPELKWESSIAYEEINISAGDDDGKGQLTFFAPGSIPGTGGDSLLSFVTGIEHDNRDYQGAPSKGGYQKVKIGYHDGIDGSEAKFFSYMADIAHYFALGSPKRVFGLRALAEHRDEVDSGTIPFHSMSKMGGYGTFPRDSHLNRGLDDNRYYDESLLLFNLEYRYTIWERDDFQLDTVWFLDIGQTFGEFSDMQLKDFKESYGVEFRVSILKYNIFNVSIAHSDEGTNFYVKTKKAF